MDLGLTDRVYVVTGGTRGLGRATAEVLVAEGARVVVAGRDQATATAAAEALGSDSAVGIVADTADPGSAERLVATAAAAFGRIDGALLSVGGPRPGTLVESDDAAWRSAFEQVLLGPLRIARHVVQATGPGGAVAFVLSTSVRSPFPGLAISNGLRPGVAMAAKTLADEVGPQGVRVVGLMPGRIATDRMTELDAVGGGDPAARRRANAQTIPLRRYGEPEEFGRVAAFVLSPAASYLTGAMIAVDGGSLRTI